MVVFKESLNSNYPNLYTYLSLGPGETIKHSYVEFDSSS
jgi:hypothetical protein